MSDRVDSIKDVILFNATPADVRAMKLKIRDYKRWLVETGLPNDLDNWESYCEMVASSN